MRNIKAKYTCNGVSSSRQGNPNSVLSSRLTPLERRLSDDSMASASVGNTKPATVRVVGAVPKKVSFSPDVIDNASESRPLQPLMPGALTLSL